MKCSVCDSEEVVFKLSLGGVHIAYCKEHAKHRFHCLDISDDSDDSEESTWTCIGSVVLRGQK